MKGMTQTQSSLLHTQKQTLQPTLFKLTKLSPISNIIPNEETSSHFLSQEKLLFCYQSMLNALNIFLAHDYTKFDPLTATNCCHGMSLLVSQLLIETSQIDIAELINLLENKYNLLKTNLLERTDLSSFQHFCLPDPIIKLTQLYLLTVIKETDFVRGGWRTVVQKLKEISTVSSKLCVELVKKLQVYFSNLVADSYCDYLECIKKDFFLHNIPIKIWGKYVQPESIKIDMRGRKYAGSVTPTYKNCVFYANYAGLSGSKPFKNCICK